MVFDGQTAETIAPVLAMIGQQARVDPNWTCTMIEAVACDVLPGFYRTKRESADGAGERAALDLKLVAMSCDRPEHMVRLAQSYSDAERLPDALYWIGKAVESEPEQGEYLRFKASILERMQMFKQAFEAAREASQRGADPDSIASDIERIENGWISHLRRNASSTDIRLSFGSYISLLEQGRLRPLEILAVLPRLAKLIVFGLKVRSDRV